MTDEWEARRRFIENGAKYGGVKGMKEAEKRWNERKRKRIK